MSKFLLCLLPLTLVVSACASGPVDDSDVAECSRLSGKIIQSPEPQRMGGDHFLRRYERDRSADIERARATKLGCK